jgi:hypothetical protein
MLIKQNRIILTNKNKSSIPFVSGGFSASGFGLKIPVNENNLGIDGVLSTGDAVTASFVPSFGIYNYGSALQGFGFFKNDVLDIYNTQNFSADISASIVPRINLSFTNVGCTIAFWIYKNKFDTVSSNYEYVLDFYGDSDNYLRIYFYNNLLNFNYKGQGTAVNKTIATSLFVDGSFNFVVFEFNIQKVIAGSDYIKIYLNNVEKENSVVQPTPLTVLPTFISIGCDYLGANSLNGVLSALQIDSLNWKDTQANATTANYKLYKSVEYYYNSGNGSDIINDDHTIMTLGYN